MAGMDVTIINTMNDDYNKQNAVAIGLATGASNVELPNLASGNLNGWIQVNAGAEITNVNGGSGINVNGGVGFGAGITPDNWNNYIQWDGQGFKVLQTCYYCNYSPSNPIYAGYISLTTNPNATPGTASSNITIDASDGLSPGELYAVGRSASNTETKDQALTITPQKMDSVLKSIERDAKS